MKFFLKLILVVSLFIAGCQSTNNRQNNGQTDLSKDLPSSAKSGKFVEEAYVHTQPDINYSYYYNVIIEKDPKAERIPEDTNTTDDNDPSKAIAANNPAEKSIWHRIRAGFRLSHSNHRRVRAEIRWFVKHPAYMQRVYDRADAVLYYIVEEIEKRGIPTELALLPIVESAFQPFAYSRAAASGIWQFIPSTGRFYGLRQDWWYDGRRDLIASTHASLAYLRKLEKQFHGDWLLALASYNSGENRVAREVRRNLRRKRSAKYWYLRLPRETRAYVPKLLALRAIILNPKKYGVTLKHIPNRPRLQIVKTKSQIDLAVAAELAGISLEEMYKLNPGFNRWATSPKGPHRLVLPIEIANEFKHKLKSLPHSKRMIWKKHRVSGSETIRSIALQHKITPKILRHVNSMTNNEFKQGQKIRIPVSYIARAKYTLTLTQRFKGSATETLSHRRKIIYRVRRGDSLSRIARRYRVSRRRLARWNRISTRKRLRRRQRLVIYIDRSKVRRSKRSSRRYRGRRRMTYIVRRGDTLHNIARRYRIRVAQIKGWNRRIRRSSRIVPGQRIKLYVKVRRRVHRRKRSRRRRRS
ncbi:Membrane-bound lytic murein transglycosylase D [hydrothermal vent metagenome]|uniref:Membrane-bound lytic murein transglycosylase D n=1 Tax=hydrothermal vent metagenome TaxID=652676 RepID=A0A3B0Z0V3_9ZZZZ